MEPNPGCALDLQWVEQVKVNFPGIKRRCQLIGTKRTVKKQWQAAWLLRAVSCIDLTTLSGDDTASNVQRLCFKAAHPVREDLLKALGFDNRNLTVGAVCVYPSHVADCIKYLKAAKAEQIPVASVATGFPSGKYSLKTRVMEIQQAVEDGAREIDIVLDRGLVLCGKWEEVYSEVRAMKAACGSAHMKCILGTGDLGSLDNVYKASLVAMMAGSDFIKTSTGKEGVNAILPVGLTMVRAIREYHQRTGIKVGFKPAGGIRTAKDACTWLALIKEELGDDWLNANMFRFGASALLSDIERQLYHYVYGRYATHHDFAMG